MTPKDSVSQGKMATAPDIFVHFTSINATPNQVVSGFRLRVTLNSSGQISPAVAIYPNTGLLPANTFSRITVYAADGTEVVPVSAVTIPNSPTPVDLATLTWGPAA